MDYGKQNGGLTLPVWEEGEKEITYKKLGLHSRYGVCSSTSFYACFSSAESLFPWFSFVSSLIRRANHAPECIIGIMTDGRESHLT